MYTSCIKAKAENAALLRHVHARLAAKRTPTHDQHEKHPSDPSDPSDPVQSRPCLRPCIHSPSPAKKKSAATHSLVSASVPSQWSQWQLMRQGPGQDRWVDAWPASRHVAAFCTGFCSGGPTNVATATEISGDARKRVGVADGWLRSRAG